MIRSMYSGVAGMKAHQARMDVIGNNIANVNTYGFKSARASFQDIYYQTLKGATQAGSNQGGTNPSQIGYGVQLGAISTNHSRSSFAMTDVGLDVAIAGEGFFQVQDADGNIFYTRSGMLDIDASGNLVDINGNFVLGVSGDPLGQVPGREKIQIAIDAVKPSASSVTEMINNKSFTITSSNRTADGNVSLSFGSDVLPEGKKAVAEITTTGIVVKLNAQTLFHNMTEVNQAINSAITEANQGKPHPAGQFNITSDPANLFGRAAVDGEIRGALNHTQGSILFEGIGNTFFGGMSIQSLSGRFTAEGAMNWTAEVYDVDGAGVPNQWRITGTGDQGEVYQGIIGTDDGVNPVKLWMTMPVANDEYIEIKQPGINAINAAAASGDPVTYAFADASAQAIATETFLGGMTVKGVSNAFEGSGQLSFEGRYDETEGWLIQAMDSSVPIRTYSGKIAPAAGSGTLRLISTEGDYLELNHPGIQAINASVGVYSGAPTTGTVLDSGAAQLSAVSYTPAVNVPLTGAEITSTDYSIIPGQIEGFPANGIFGGMEFKETSRDFQGNGEVTVLPAIYHEASTTSPVNPAYWEISMSISGKTYTGRITDGRTGDVYLTNPQDGDQIIFTNPGFAAVTDSFQGAPEELVEGAAIVPAVSGTVPQATASQPTKSLGLGSKNLVLSGGTEGGAQSVADLSSITIGGDGVIEAVHAVHGRIRVGRIDLATFQNTRGLEQSGNTYFKETGNSGPAKRVNPGTSGAGSLAAGSLEQSNVDLTSEFSDMITTQRGFQANSRMITVSDTMLEELVNLKR